MEYYSLDTAQHNQQKTWQITSISLAAVIALLSLELFYLLSKLSDLDIVHLGLGISQVQKILWESPNLDNLGIKSPDFSGYYCSCCLEASENSTTWNLNNVIR